MTNALESFPRGLLRQELFLGLVSAVSATQARLNLSVAEQPSGSHFEAGRYGRGEVGELVLIEGQVDLILGRVVDVRVGESERWGLGAGAPSSKEVSGFVQFLGSVRPDTLHVTAGVTHYPRLGDRVYAAPHAFVGRIPHFMEKPSQGFAPVQLCIGAVSGRADAQVLVRPEKLFGRHCAVLGATGGGKSWTVSRLLEECITHNAKVLLLDPTSEYRAQAGPFVEHCHMGQPVERADGSRPVCLPPSDFTESDFIALFEPSGKVQGPKLREAIRSLRLVNLKPDLAEEGILKKARKEKKPLVTWFKRHSQVIEDPSAPFDASRLAKQLMEECVFPDGGTSSNPDSTYWGGYSDSDKTYCLPLASRVNAIVRSDAFAPVFGDDTSTPPLGRDFQNFLASQRRLLRVCVGGVSYEYRAREFIANAIGRMLLTKARAGAFRERPLIVVVDEAHNFLGRHVGSEDSMVRLDAFEIIAREGRKYGLNLCLATQRPRDLTEGVLSQIGTLVVHRLTNERDREVVEKACGEIDRSAAAFLANLKQGEAAIVGADFPIPMTVQISAPTQRPFSDGPDYQKAWSVPFSTDGADPTTSAGAADAVGANNS